MKKVILNICINNINIFILQMWEAILDRVDDSKDLQSFCKAWKFPDFYTILHRTKQSWLIDQVINTAFIKNR